MSSDDKAEKDGRGATRPEIPKKEKLSSLNAKTVHDLVSDAKAWFNLEQTKKAAAEAVVKTKEFLIKNTKSTNEYGDEISSKEGGWLAIRGLDPLDPTKDEDFARLDLRRSTLRTRAFAVGMCRFLGLLDEREALPKGASDYFDDATNLAPIAVHETLMGWQLAKQKTKSFNLEDLKPWFLYAPPTHPRYVRPHLIFMTNLGLWDAEFGRAEGQWHVRVGPIAKIFHMDAFVPTLKHFEPLMINPPPTA